MKIKKTLLKFTALFLCIVFLLPVTFACGDKKPAGDDTTNAGTTGAETEADKATDPPVADIPTDPPTEPPTTTEPPPTEPPLPPYEADPNLPYWEQIRLELEYYGLTGGVFALSGADEAELMKKFSPSNCKKADLDVSGDKVPFSSAYSVVTAKDMPNYGGAEYKAQLARDNPIKQDDLVIGVFWIKGERLSETEQYAKDEPPQYFLAVKSTTDAGREEGDVTPHGGQDASGEWQKVFFYGRVLNEENNSRNIDFRFFLGYGNQRMDIGGVVVYLFPFSPETEAAAEKLVASTQK